MGVVEWHRLGAPRATTRAGRHACEHIASLQNETGATKAKAASNKKPTKEAGDPWLYVYQGETGSIQRADYDPAFFAIRNDGTLVAFSAVGARWRRPPGPGHDESKEWPGVVQKLDRKYRIEYLPLHDLLVLYSPDGGFRALGCDGTRLLEKWRDGRGVDHITELDGDLLIDGAIGRWRIHGFGVPGPVSI